MSKTTCSRHFITYIITYVITSVYVIISGQNTTVIVQFANDLVCIVVSVVDFHTIITVR